MYYYLLITGALFSTENPIVFVNGSIHSENQDGLLTLNGNTDYNKSVKDFSIKGEQIVASWFKA